MELTEFLRARLDEDEATAQAATAGPWSVADRGDVMVTGSEDAYGYPHYVTCDFEGLRASVDAEDADHIARWDPARVLAEVEARRRIVERFAPIAADTDA